MQGCDGAWGKYLIVCPLPNSSTGVFQKATLSLVRPWALILGGHLYDANI